MQEKFGAGRGGAARSEGSISTPSSPREMGGGRRTAGEAGVRRDAVMTPQRGIRERGPPPRQRGWGGGDEADLGASAPYSRRSRTAARFAGRDPSPAAAWACGPKKNGPHVSRDPVLAQQLWAAPYTVPAQHGWA